MSVLLVVESVINQMIGLMLSPFYMINLTMIGLAVFCDILKPRQYVINSIILGAVYDFLFIASFPYAVILFPIIAYLSLVIHRTLEMNIISIIIVAIGFSALIDLSQYFITLVIGSNDLVFFEVLWFILLRQVNVFIYSPIIYAIYVINENYTLWNK